MTPQERADTILQLLRNSDSIAISHEGWTLIETHLAALVATNTSPADAPREQLRIAEMMRDLWRDLALRRGRYLEEARA